MHSSSSDCLEEYHAVYPRFDSRFSPGCTSTIADDQGTSLNDCCEYVRTTHVTDLLRDQPYRVRVTPLELLFQEMIAQRSVNHALDPSPKTTVSQVN